MASRTLRFSISSALLAAPLALGVACGGGETEEPETNVATTGDEQPHTNVHPEHEHENEDPTANPTPDTGTEPESATDSEPVE
jgi:hypothetical protein